MLRLYRDLKRILVVTENLLFLSGRSLQRRAMRNGVLITLAMSSSIIKTNYTSAQTLSSDQLTALLVGAFASYPAGTLLVRLAGFLTRDKIDAAAGGYLHLTSHYKQSRMRLHLHYLWHEVFGNDPTVTGRVDDGGAVVGEPLIRDTDDFGLFREQHADAADARAHDRFVQVGLSALRSPLPMGVQSARIGFHLGPVEDWYEKGFFAYEDFPAKAFVRDPLIKRARALVDSPGRARLRRLLSTDAAPSFWYAFTARRFASLLGKAISRINHDAEAAAAPDYFDAQHFTWPSEALDDEVRRRFPGDDSLADRLVAARRQVMREVFSDEGETARRHLLRMFARDYAMIFDLRMRFDGAFAAGLLPATPRAELDALARAFSFTPPNRKRVERQIADAGERQRRLGEALAQVPDAGVDAAGLALMQVAAQIDYHGFAERCLGDDDGAALATVLAEPGEFTAHAALLHELLQRVRIYHALIKIQLLDYWSIIHRVGEIEPFSARGPAPGEDRQQSGKVK